MKVLFVSSGNKNQVISTIVKVQGESLLDQGIDVEFYPIKGKGFWSYLNNILILRHFLKRNNFDLIHAHYSLSAIVASMAGARPLVVSLMGSDVKAKKWYKWLILIYYKFCWDQTIVKSEDMKRSLGFSKIIVVPNGVDFNRFYPIDKSVCQSELMWASNKKHILFPSNPARPEKNYALLAKSIRFLENTEIHTLVDVPYHKVPVFMNAADVVVLTSLWEGSPNVIKEAMACNCLIVSTAVGDVIELFENAKGCFITSYDDSDLANIIKNALKSGERSNGRVNIARFESKIIALRIMNIYSEIL